jgi:hypothetical protein
MEDARRVGYCVKGQRRWAQCHGLDFVAYLTDGIDSEVLRATGDAFALKILARLEAEAGAGA